MRSPEKRSPGAIRRTGAAWVHRKSNFNSDNSYFSPENKVVSWLIFLGVRHG
jgi:hypothetical protein